MLITSDVAYPIKLESVSLVNTDWQTDSSIVRPEQPQLLQKNDIYAASFYMRASSTTGICPVGDLQISFRRLDKNTPHIDDTAGLVHAGTFVVVHHLCDVCVCNEVCSLSLKLPLLVHVGERFSASICIDAPEDRTNVLSGSARISTGSGVQLDSSADQEIAGGERSSRELVWEMTGQQSKVVDVCGHVEVAVGGESDVLAQASVGSDASVGQTNRASQRHSLQLSGSVLVTGSA